MPSNRLTKMNVDVDQKEFVDTVATAKGISSTKMLEIIILFYITHAGAAPRSGTATATISYPAKQPA